MTVDLVLVRRGQSGQGIKQHFLTSLDDQPVVETVGSVHGRELERHPVRLRTGEKTGRNLGRGG